MPIFSKINTDQFIITIEVVPPNGNDPSHLLSKLSDITNLNFQAYSVASNPVAKPKMSALVFAHLLQQQLKKKAILHFTTRDHNQLSLQSELWGAKVLGIDTIIAVTGDPSSAKSGTGASVSMPVDGLSCNDTLLVTVTKQNHYRYSGPVVCYAVSMTNESIASGELIFIYSNPVYDNIWIKFSNGFYEKLILQIMDSKGEIV